MSATEPPEHNEPGSWSPRQGSREASRSSRSLATLLDDLFTIPGTSIGIGLDSIIGLIPGVGDALGSTMTSFIMFEAMQKRVSLTVLLRMGLNLIVDLLLGLVPGVGDVLDVAHRANRKNLRLLEASLVSGRTSRLSPVAYVGAALALILLAIALGVGSLIMVIYLLIKVIS